MASTSANLKASANFDVKPAKSQVVLVSLSVAAMIALLIGGGLLAVDKPSGWPFVAISTALFAAIVWCWRQSQRDTDLAQSHPTKVVLADGANLSTDSRLLSSPQGVRDLSKVIESLAMRQPLPAPSGLTGPNGVPIPNSEAGALEVVESINADTQRLHDQALLQLNEQLMGKTASQEADHGRKLPHGATVETGSRNSIFAPTSDNSSSSM